jgi:alkyl hydroperoxide reductase subunit AhpC
LKIKTKKMCILIELNSPFNKKGKIMATIRLGDTAPDFKANTTEGEISFHQWLGESWGVLFSHPADFTPVCTTELGTVAKYKPKFDQRNVKVAALSVDGISSHHEWINDINETQDTVVNFPIIADEDRQVATLYDMIHPNANDKLTVRSVYVIGSDKKIKLIITYPASTGRNFDELLRVIDSLQLTAYHKVATPANWKDGEDCVVVPAIATADIPSIFPKGHTEIKPYLRMTPQPNK